MEIDSIHFYVKDAARMRDWSISQLGLQELANDRSIDPHTSTYRVGNERLCLTISSPLDPSSPIAEYLQAHPPGVRDITFRVRSLDEMRQKLDRLKIEILATSSFHDNLPWLKVRGWGAIEHTIIQSPSTVAAEFELNSSPRSEPYQLGAFTGIDHLVLNVAVGELASAVAWYHKLFDFQVQQTFEIHTPTSGLASTALVSANGQVRFNINEPSSANSQIQEFLDVNCGAGIQHVALHTADIFGTVDRLRQQGVAFLPIPKTYYTSLKMRAQSGIAARLTHTELARLEQLEILADWSDAAPKALLMQIFTKPIFEEPTFFFEVIQRRHRAQGFGNGNFQALFEAIERHSDRLRPANR